MKKGFALFLVGCAGTGLLAGAEAWPEPTREMRPWACLAWRGDEADLEELDERCADLAEKGFGGFRLVAPGGAVSPEALSLAAQKADENELGFTSAAPGTGGTLVAATCGTGLGAPLHASPAELKQAVDRLFLGGANHLFYDGELTPDNPLWREIGALNAYVTRCQSLFQTWTRDGGNPGAMPFSPAQNGLAATRWTKDGRTMYFVVNLTATPRLVTAAKPFTIFAPQIGTVVEKSRVKLLPGRSAFLLGDDFQVEAASAEVAGAKTALPGPWTVTSVEGGPALAPAKTIAAVAGWHTWDAAFSGTMTYQTRFDVPDAAGRLVLDLGDVREIARVRLNGIDLGVRFIAPFRFGIPEGLLRTQGNTLEIDVTSLGANRLAAGSGAAKPAVVPSGLLGPVQLTAPAAW